MREWLESLDGWLGLGSAVQQRILASLVVALVSWLLHQIFLRAYVYRLQDARARYQWQKASGYAIFLAALLIIGRIWFEGVQVLATFFGLLSAGLAVALRDPITNLFAWAFILWRRPFEVGDRIEIGAVAGDVIDQRIFQFTLMEIGNWVQADQSTGRIMHVPNGMIFTSPLANYTKGSDYIWNEIPVLITFESDWQKAKNVLREIADRLYSHLAPEMERSFQAATRRFLLKYSKLTPVVYTSVESSGVLLTIRYLCEPRQRRGTAEEVWENILKAFAKHDDIELAYPTQRFYNYPGETSKDRSESQIPTEK